MNVFNRISLISLIKKHYETFYDDAFYRLNGKKRIPKGDKVVFIGIPLILSTSLIACKIFISEGYLNIVLTCLSIFAGLLFGLLSLVFELTKSIKEQVEDIKRNPIIGDLLEKKLGKEELKYKILKELFINIGFAISLSIFAICTNLLTLFKPPLIISILNRYTYYFYIKTTYLIIFNFISYFLIFLFVITILMILKRFYLLFESETTE